MLPRWHYLWNSRNPSQDEHYINVYKNEFINTYERDINLRNLRGDARRRARNIVSRWRNFIPPPLRQPRRGRQDVGDVGEVVKNFQKLELAKT